jgi:hypothetical protein
VVGVEDSAHHDVGCTECHPDFKYDDSEDETNLWPVNASYACMECHVDVEGDDVVVSEYLDSVHGQELLDGNLDSASCSSCHGGHYIQRLDSEAAQQSLHGSAFRVCARCHRDQWDSYDDYYHGAAYKRGAPDAPSCWDCHDDHMILSSADASSTVSQENLPGTCGECHDGSEEAFVNQAVDLIHQSGETRESNPLLRFFSNLFGWLG